MTTVFWQLVLMKKEMLRYSVLLILIALACEYDYDITVEARGTAGTRFAGTIRTSRRGIDSVSGTVPTEWTVPVANVDDTIFVSFQKDSLQGKLIVRLLVDGQLETECGTTEPGGVVNLTWYRVPS